MAAVPANPLANWERVGDRFYRRVRIYDAVFDEDVDLESCIVSVAPYGGALGMFLTNWKLMVASSCANPRI